jgi:20S proteasome subunit alpha 6
MRGGGRGGGSMLNAGGEGRGGGSGRGGSLRGHGSRGGFGGGRRGGGSFGGPNMGGSFRGGRGGGSGYHGGGRNRNAGHGGAGPTPLGPSASFNAGSKKDENRRTLTDFKIVGFELPDMNWSWGVVPKPIEAPAKEPDNVEPIEVHEHSSSHKEVGQDGKPADGVSAAVDEASEQVKDGAVGPSAPASGEAASTTDAAPERSPTISVAEPVAPAPEPSAKDGPPPARLRIYFHTPASYDDSLNLGSSAWSWDQPDATRKGKRKKGDDEDEDDVDLEEGRVRPRPPGEEHDRASVAPSVEMRSGSVAPSVAETMSEGDWLMAAFGGERGPEGEHEFEDAEDTGASTFAHGEAASSSRHIEGLFEHLEPVPEAHNDASEHPPLTDSGELHRCSLRMKKTRQSSHARV